MTERLKSDRLVAATRLERVPRRADAQRVPVRVDGNPGMVLVDASWGIIQPLQLPGDIETVGELEVKMGRGGSPAVTRQPDDLAWSHCGIRCH